MLIVNPKIITLNELRSLALRAIGLINVLYLHWTAGRYDQVFDDYHLNIGKNGEIYLTCHDLSEKKAHTWRRNSNAAGITLCCCLGAKAKTMSNAPPIIDYGPCSPTQAQIETMAQVIAIITEICGLDISEETVMTHQEAATLDGYGPGSGDPETRWDLWYLPDRPVTDRLVQGGRVLRGKAIWYRFQYSSELATGTGRQGVARLEPEAY